MNCGVEWRGQSMNRLPMPCRGLLQGTFGWSSTRVSICMQQRSEGMYRPLALRQSSLAHLMLLLLQRLTAYKLTSP